LRISSSNCGAVATLSRFLNNVTLPGGLLGRISPTYSTNWGLIVTVGNLTSTEQTTAIKGIFAANDVRALVANHLGVSVGRVTDEAHFTDDLGADWLDRLDLMIEGRE
jgi:hypothetical protein